MDTCENASWIPVWLKTGTLGKQVILSELIKQARPPRRSHHNRTIPAVDPKSAKEALEHILSIIESQQEETPDDAKASLTHKVMCLAALMTSHAPSTDLTTAALRQIYNRLDDHELSNIAQNWKESPAQGRTTIYYAARLLEALRSSNNHATHYAMPVYLLRAILTLWIYARLFDDSNITGFVLSIDTEMLDPNNVNIDHWTRAGCSRICLPGITDLLSPQGRRTLLSEAVDVMQTLSCWGISKVYLHLLRRLQTSEVAS